MWLECHNWTVLKKLCLPCSISVQAEYCAIRGAMYRKLKNEKKCGKK